MQRESRWWWSSLSVGIALLVICCEKPTTLYYNESPAFSVEYPKQWNVTRKLFMGDVMSVSATDRYTSLKINISFRSEYDTADAPKACIAALQKMYPESSRHKVQLEKMILLEDGTRALYVFVSCKLDDERIFLVSSNVVAFKDNRTVMVICTTLARKPFDVLQDVTHSLRFAKLKQVKLRAQPKATRIAIMDFMPKGISPSLALDISEMIRAEMKKNGKYKVIERTQMNELLKRFQQIECTIVPCAIKVARLLSVQKIMIGSVMKMGATIAISGSLVDAEKGAEERSITHVAYSKRDIPNAVAQFIRKLRGI